mmetsp:Transcript_18367/g.27753  ORF Transcript_18367/g.27753 Transcript_18367/m.27753 type:complete len:284 (+) Transcript_18367:195-1046(+)
MYPLKTTISREVANHLCSAQRGKLFRFFQCHSLSTLIKLSLCLKTHNSTTPFSGKISIVVEFLSSQVFQNVKLSRIAGSNTSQSNACSSLGMNQRSQASFIFNNHERNIHFSAQGWHPHNKLKRIYVTCNANKFCLFLFDSCSDFFETISHNIRRLARSLAFSCISRTLLDALLSGFLRLRTILIEKCENGHRFVFGDNICKLINGRRNLQSLVKNSSLALNANVFRPLYETRKITTLWTDCSTDTSCTRTCWKKWISLGLSRFRLIVLLSSFLWCHCNQYLS